MSKKFTEEFKTQAVKLVLEQGLTQDQVCRDLGFGHSTLAKWLAAYKSAGLANGTIKETELEELKRLRKEVHTLRMERDILKKATAYFAKHTL
jgi:transposase